MSRRWASRSVAGALVAPLILCSCAGFRIHDEGRAKLAAAGKQSYVDAKVPEVVEADRKNLQLLLGEELKVVRDSFALQVNFAALEIANNATPMASTYDEAAVRLKALGFESPKDVRVLLHHAIDARETNERLGDYEKVFRSAKVPPPPCASAPEKLTLPATIDKKLADRLNAIYPEYFKLCQARLAGMPRRGLLASAYAQWSEAKAAQDDRRHHQSEAAVALQSAKTAYEAVMEEIAKAENRGKDLSARITSTSAALKSALDAAKGLDGVDNESSIEALVDLLTASAGGEVDPADKKVARAAIVAKEIPSVAQDISDLQARRTRPPVSGLLIALRHQTILAEHAKKRVALADERVNVLKARYDAYQTESERWLQFTDAMCNYAVRSAGGKHPGGAKCDQFVVDQAGACTLEGKPLSQCALNNPWNERLRASQAPEHKREMYKAVAAYLQAIALQARPEEERFREIDVRHRETLLAKKTAIDVWDNLVNVPLDQLNAFYQTGIKPAEIADLIIKALGFTAIAIGVSK